MRILKGTRITLYWERYADARGRYDRELDVVDRDSLPVMYQEDMGLSAVYGLNKWRLGQTIMDEILLSIRRAGADLIITYHALEFARAVKRNG